MMVPEASKPAADPLSIWEAVTPKRNTSDALLGAKETETVIIGGGFTGLSTALHLAKSGHKVCLVEGKTIGWGGSGRNNGQVIPVLSAVEPAGIEKHYGEAGERLVALIRDSADYLFELVRNENISCEAEQAGWFQPAHTVGHMRVSEMRVNAWAKRGAPCQLLDASESQKLLGSKAWYGGMLNPTGGHINPLMLARGLATACEQAGVTIHENSPVTAISRKGQRWAVTTQNGTLECESVLLATNAYSNELASGLEPKTARSIVPVTSWQMATEPLSKELQKEILPGRQAISDTRGDLQFFRYDARNTLITGAAMLLPHNAAGRLNEFVGQRLATSFPQMGKPTFTHIWSGYVGITPDHYPHFHQLGPGYFAAIGFNGRGVALSVSMGRELARAIKGDDLKELALPLSSPKQIPFHAIARRVARGALTYYRWRDRQIPKI
jgi:glycine/D-amino acid oxidase-like deaminating enzyme